MQPTTNQKDSCDTPHQKAKPNIWVDYVFGDMFKLFLLVWCISCLGLTNYCDMLTRKYGKEAEHLSEWGNIINWCSPNEML